ncbi:MAG: DUF4105 domain-containing protein [Candidatus Eisenbacteria bacterium]
MSLGQGSARTVLLVGALPLLFLLVHPPGAGASGLPAPEATYVRELVDLARAAKLHEDPYWRTLLHCKQGLFGPGSLVDDPKFFASPKGKHDPEAELEATIRSFFLPPPEEGKHPVCRFAARFDWLKEKLEIDESRLPVPVCGPFEELMDRIRPESITLIFPTSHMNSPASMYGHTLLTVDTAYDSELLSYAINYSAVTDETFGPYYIAKGLFGLYKGYFSILPYYAKLQEYRDVNDRDIWEYPLDLDDGEIRRLLLHIYELEDVYSDYFFFNENCSYDLLFLLDAARPGLGLTDRCAWWVIPLDTIREIKKSGLVRDVVYRPSKSTKIKHIASLLPERGIDDALAVARGDLEPEKIAEADMPKEEKILVCDLASEYLQYEYMGGKLAKDAYIDRFMKTLKARSDLGGAGEERYAIPPPARPDEGHHSNRVSVGYGVTEDRPFQELRLRPAYHVLLDNDGGYKRGSQIVFFEFALRYHSGDDRLEMESLNLIDILSLAPRDRFFAHTSWKIGTGFFRRTMEDGRRSMVYGLNPGFGRAYESDILGLWYLMIETDLHVGGALDGGHSAGAGASTGILRNLTGRWKLHLFARDVYHGLGDRDNLFRAGLGQNFEISADRSLTAEVGARIEREETEIESSIRLNAFF